MYNLWDKYLTNNYIVTNEIIGSYATFLLSGFTLQITSKAEAKILVGTIRGYLHVVNKHYHESGFNKPWDPKDDSDASVLLREQEKFEKEPARRSPLNPKVIAKMCILAKEDPLGFRACVYDFTGIGRFGGFRQQEFAMDSKNNIKMYVLPDGKLVVRSFTVSNFIFYDKDGIQMQKPLQNRSSAQQLGTLFEVQKNRMNNQVIKHARLSSEYADYCPVELGLKIVTRAQLLGNTAPDDPLCVYKNDKGKTVYLTGDDVTDYYRFVTRLVMPNITDEELNLISTHSIRVTACVLLHEAGKDGPYIKLRLRWLSNCFEIYLRNTETITAQHVAALDPVHRQMTEMALTASNMNEVVFEPGQLNMTMDDLEDED